MHYGGFIMLFFTKIKEYIKEHTEQIVLLKLGINWNEDIPAPYMLSSGTRRSLAFRTCNEGGKVNGNITLIEFINCRYIYFGGLNRRNFIRNMFYKKKLCNCSAHVVENSKWIAGIKKINGGSEAGAEYWTNTRHYIFTFSDVTFECIADGYRIKQTDGSAKSRIKPVKDAEVSAICR
jgi:hypothetical protein